MEMVRQDILKMKERIQKEIRIVYRAIILSLSELLKKWRVELMVRRVCEKKGLSEEQADLIVAVINCESGMDTRAINDNGNGTIDYGLCQFNDYWYWTIQQIIHPDVALNDPKKAVEVMVDRYKAGHLKDWVCYSTGMYKRHLSKVANKKLA